MSETFALSAVQRRLWSHAGTTSAQAEYEITGADDAAIARALAALADRWEILRTRFPVPPGLAAPVQAIGDDPAWTCTVTAGRVRISLAALSMDRAGYALLGQALAAELAGAPMMEGPQYPDVAAWLDDLAEGPDGEAGRSFWTRADMPANPAAVMPIPPPGHTEREGPAQAPVPGRLVKLAAGWAQPVELVLLAAWHVLLQRLTGQRSSRVAVAMDGRAQAALHMALGPLTRWLPGSLAADPDAPLAAILPGLAARIAQQRDWQDCTAGGDAPFGFRVQPAPPASLVQLLGCVLPDEPHALRLIVDGATLRLEGEGGAYILRALLAFLHDLADRPHAPVGRLSLMPAPLHDRLVRAFNATTRVFPDTNAAALFEAACDRDPAAVALMHTGRALSYGALDGMANAVAARLAAHGIGPEHRVGLLAPRSPALLASLLGILKCGAAFVPLDPASPPARNAWIAADAGLAAILHAPGHTPPPHILAVPLDDEVAAPRRRRPAPHPESLAYVLHTSGSTGRPKGVAVSHRGLANYLLWAGDAYRPEAGSGVPVHTSPAFDLTITALLLPLTRGQWLDLLDEDDPVAALAQGLASAADWSFVKLTPSHLKALGDRPAAGGARRLVVGGEALFAEQLGAWAALEPGLTIVNEYGPTETVVGCAVHEARVADLSPGPVPIGHPIANTTMLVLDPSGSPVPPGVAGEGWIGGAGVARG